MWLFCSAPYTLAHSPPPLWLAEPLRLFLFQLPDNTNPRFWSLFLSRSSDCTRRNDGSAAPHPAPPPATLLWSCHHSEATGPAGKNSSHPHISAPARFIKTVDQRTDHHLQRWVLAVPCCHLLWVKSPLPAGLRNLNDLPNVSVFGRSGGGESQQSALAWSVTLPLLHKSFWMPGVGRSESSPCTASRDAAGSLASSGHQSGRGGFNGLCSPDPPT